MGDGGAPGTTYCCTNRSRVGTAWRLGSFVGSWGWEGSLRLSQKVFQILLCLEPARWYVLILFNSAVLAARIGALARGRPKGAAGDAGAAAAGVAATWRR